MVGAWRWRRADSCRALEASIRTQESTHKVPKPALQVVLGGMQLTLHATRRTPDGAFALGARNVLVGENPTYSVRAL